MSSPKKVILITGAAKRLGRLLALGLSSPKNAIAIHYHRSEREAKSLLRQIKKKGQTAALFKADLNKVSQIQALTRKVVKMFGRIDVLINNAAIFYPTPLGKIREQDWDSFLDTNLKAPFFCSQAVIHQMLKQKGNKKDFRVINIADSGGPKTRGNYLPYWVSKAGLMAMTETLAKILTPGIQVNTIAPGPILFPEDRQQLKNQMPINPNEILKCVRYLVEEATSITGNTFVIDGGRRYR